MSSRPDPPTKRRWNFVEWATVLSLVLAVLGFLGYGTWRAFIPQTPPTPAPTLPPTPAGSGSIAATRSASQPPTNGAHELTYRPPSDLAGEAWVGTIEGREVTLRFDGTSYAGDVSVSDPASGQSGRWHAIGRQYIDIQLAGPQRTIMGTINPDGETMAVTISVPGKKAFQYGTLQRLH